MSVVTHYTIIGINVKYSFCYFQILKLFICY